MRIPFFLGHPVEYIKMSITQAMRIFEQFKNDLKEILS